MHLFRRGRSAAICFQPRPFSTPPALRLCVVSRVCPVLFCSQAGMTPEAAAKFKLFEVSCSCARCCLRYCTSYMCCWLVCSRGHLPILVACRTCWCLEYLQSRLRLLSGTLATCYYYESSEKCQPRTVGKTQHKL